MARPYKQGLQYFPLDVSIFEDDKIQDLSMTHGHLGEIVYVRLLTMIYSSGYYLEKSVTSLARMIVKNYGGVPITPQEVETIIRFCGEIGLFDHQLLLSGVLTSKSIQKQFIMSTRRRKQADIDKYQLLSTETIENLKLICRKTQNINVDIEIDNANNNQVNESTELVNDNNNRVNAYQSTQRVKESKRDIKDRIDKAVYGFPKLHFLTNSIIQKKYISNASLDLIKFNKLFEETIECYGVEDVLMAVDYIVQFAKHSETTIEEPFGYMKESLNRNLDIFKRKREFSNESFEDWYKRTFL